MMENKNEVRGRGPNLWELFDHWREEGIGVEGGREEGGDCLAVGWKWPNYRLTLARRSPHCYPVIVIIIHCHRETSVAMVLVNHFQICTKLCTRVWTLEWDYLRCNLSKSILVLVHPDAGASLLLA